MIRFGTTPIAWSHVDDPGLGGDIPLERCLAEVAAIGFDGIEQGHKMPGGADALHAALKPHGLAFVAGWHPLNLLTRSVEAEKDALFPVLDTLRAMGSAVLIVSEMSDAVHALPDAPSDARPVLDAGRWAEFGAGIEALAGEAAMHGITLAYHPHMGTVVQSDREVDALMEATGPGTRLVLDTGHCTFAGGDPVALARTHMDRIAHIHAKNVRAGVLAEAKAERLSVLHAIRRGIFTVPGDPDGCVDFPGLLAVAAEHHYDGWLVIEADQDPRVHAPAMTHAMGLGALRAMAATAGLVVAHRAGP